MRNVIPRLVLASLLALASLNASAGCPRIVSQSPYLTIALEWLGRGDCIVGVSRYDRRALPRTGGVIDPDGAAIEKLRPDLIVTSNWSDADTMELVTPPGARMLRLDGFDSVAGSDAVLRQLAEASRAPGGAERIESFRRARRARAESVRGLGQRALILSACSGSPYSFGRRHYVGDAFALAGFDVVETAPKIRHLRDGEEIPNIARLVERLKPAIVFSLSRETAAYCNAEIGTLPVRIVTLKGENFFHPGPRLLDGLEDLAEQMK
ncbi:MAG: ABC transporter substrate-binding protein [Rhodocyclaceae bacterium]|jgi:iron complex transport system substrate-binding protein|nr:ABC transporter substrate-binding protein [Rhodocyclaceae bacterium]